jgi:hypothetical protein
MISHKRVVLSLINQKRVEIEGIREDESFGFEWLSVKVKKLVGGGGYPPPPLRGGNYG